MVCHPSSDTKTGPNTTPIAIPPEYAVVIIPCPTENFPFGYWSLITFNPMGELAIAIPWMALIMSKVTISCANPANAVVIAKAAIINTNIFFAPKMSLNRPINMVITAPEIMYTDMTQDARESSTLNSFAIVGMAGDKEVCKKRISKVVPVIIKVDFHAVKDISSDLVGLFAVVDMKI